MSKYRTWAEWNAVQIKLLQKRNRIERELVGFVTSEQAARINKRLDKVLAEITAHDVDYVPSTATYAFGSRR